MKYLLLFLTTLLTFSLVAQDEDEEPYEEEEYRSFFIGVNVGSHFANKKTAMKYSGFSLNTYGVEWFFNNPQNEARLREQFDGQPYKIDQQDLLDLPNRMKYRPSWEIGGIAGLRLSDGLDLFLEANVAQLKTENVFVVEVTPSSNTNNIEADRYRSFPVYGKEERLNLNLGLRIRLYEGMNYSVQLPIFFNFNSVKLKENYFMLDENQPRINILHNSQNVIVGTNGAVISNNNTQPPGGTGYGLGSGLLFNYQILPSIAFEISYNIMYSKITVDRFLDPPFTGTGIQQNVLFRVIWG
jgi:hypothetical protein